MSQWYYTQGGQQHGPIGYEELKELADSGQLHRGDPVWEDRMACWTVAGAVQGLFPPSRIESLAASLADAWAGRSQGTNRAKNSLMTTPTLIVRLIGLYLLVYCSMNLIEISQASTQFARMGSSIPGVGTIQTYDVLGLLVSVAAVRFAGPIARVLTFDCEPRDDH